MPIAPPASCCVAWGKRLFLSGPTTAPTAAQWESVSRGVRIFCPCLYSDPSQSDPETKDFWLNMAALTEALQHQAEQNPTASYYNLVLLRYQVGLRAGGARAGYINNANNR